MSRIRCRSCGAYMVRCESCSGHAVRRCGSCSTYNGSPSKKEADIATRLRARIERDKALGFIDARTAEIASGLIDEVTT